MRKLLTFAMMFIPAILASQEKHSCCTTATQEFAALASDAGFAALHSAPLPLTFEIGKGGWVKVKTEDTLEARLYVVKADMPTNNYLLVFHEWWGLNDYIRREAESLRKELGTVNVIAVDLYDGKLATTREDAVKCVQSVSDDRARHIIEAAIKYAGEQARIATIGWCFGGGWSLQASLMAEKRAVACVIYYGMPEKDVEKLKSLNSPVLGIFAKQDQGITPEIVARFEKDMKEAGKELTVKSFDAVHAFANPSNPMHDKEATAEAHKLVMEFFATHFLK